MKNTRKTFNQYLQTTGSLLLLVAALSGCGDNNDNADNNPPPASGLCSAWPENVDLSFLQGNAQINQVIALNDCSLLLAGYHLSSHGLDNLGDSTGFVLQLDNNADNQISTRWFYELDTSGSESVDGMKLIPTDNGSRQILFWGSTTRSVVAGTTNQGDRDIVIGTLSLEGTLQTLQQTGNECPEHVIRLFLDDNQTFNAFANQDECTPGNYLSELNEPVILSGDITANGYETTARAKKGSSSLDYFGDAIATDDGFFAIINKQATGGKGGVTVVSYDASGTLIWNTRLSVIPYDVGTHISLMDNGQVKVIGSTYTTLGEVSRGQADLYVAILDPVTGEVDHIDQYGTAEYDWLGTALPLADEQLLVVDILDTFGKTRSSLLVTRDGDICRQDMNEPTTIRETRTVAATAMGYLIAGYSGNYNNNQVMERRPFLQMGPTRIALESNCPATGQESR